ncbi:MAG TPA: polysaccharide deacetylase family protein [Azonexus sp.]|nr:polysaccharide deacetylase family protein [Azonexus sp.]
MWKLLTRLTSPGGNGGSLSVLYFHRVLAERDPLFPDEPTADEFDTMMGWVQKQFTVIPLAEGVQRLINGSLPPAAAAITFDDGYRDNLEVAAPILKRRNLPATLFVASGFVDGGIMFNDMVIEAIRRTSMPVLELAELGIAPLPLGSWEERRDAVSRLLPAIKHLPAPRRSEIVASLGVRAQVTLPDDLMMTKKQLRDLAGLGFEIGAHTENHPILAVLPDDHAYREITRGREQLEDMIDKRVGLFAYPNGRWGKDFDERHVAMAKACGFDAAFSTEPGVCCKRSDLWSLPRFTPWDRTSMRFHLRMLSNSLVPSHSRQS